MLCFTNFVPAEVMCCHHCWDAPPLTAHIDYFVSINIQQVLMGAVLTAWRKWVACFCFMYFCVRHCLSAAICYAVTTCNEVLVERSSLYCHTVSAILLSSHTATVSASVCPEYQNKIGGISLRAGLVQHHIKLYQTPFILFNMRLLFFNGSNHCAVLKGMKRLMVSSEH